MEKKIRKLIIGFFAVMIVFTFISRAAASVVVPKVQVETEARGNLTYEVTGTGIVKADAHKYIDLVTGYKIGKINVREGQKVKKGDLLFSYDVKQLQDAESDQEDALKKLQLQYDNVGLTNVRTDSTADKNIAYAAVENAQEDIKTARDELKDIRRTVKKSKEKDYNEAVAELENLETSKETAVKETERAIEDAAANLMNIHEPETMAKDKISNYQKALESKDSELIARASDELFNFYYGGKYKDHQQKVADSEKTLSRAKEDLADVKDKWNNTEIYFFDQFSSNIDIRNAYHEKLASKQQELDSAQRALEDAKENLDHLTEEDQKLTDAISTFRYNVERASTNILTTEDALFQILSQGKVADQSQITEAERKLSRAKEDEKQTENDWKKKLNTAASKAEKLQKELEAIKTGSYDYMEDEKVKKEELKKALRTLKEQKLQLNKTEDSIQSTDDAWQNQMKFDDNERNSLMLDMNKAEKELQNLQNIISAKGKIYAAAAGVISENDLEQGAVLTGQEKLIITTGGYELTMSADKEEMKYFADKDEIKIMTGADNASITSEIENINPSDQEGKVNFTAILPKGDYQIGANLSYTLSKDSQDYSVCVPIQALRQDTGGTYVLIAKETDSILGTIDEAFRINVTVLSKDRKSAAVDAALTEEDKIIIGSNRNFEEGDRVRIYEME